MQQQQGGKEAGVQRLNQHTAFSRKPAEMENSQGARMGFIPAPRGGLGWDKPFPKNLSLQCTSGI